MKTAENVQQNDPLETINQYYKEKAQLRRLYRYFRGKGVTREELQNAYNQMKTEGIQTVGELMNQEAAEAEPEFGLLAKYGLALRIRATKLFLAEKGRLGEYQEFNWLQTIPIPDDLQPTNRELDEVDKWANDRDTRITTFVDELSKRANIFIECGYGISPDATRVYLFQEAQEGDKKSLTYKSEPLLDVMQALKASKKELEPLSVKNTLAFVQSSESYNGIFSETGRQKIADFFGKPTHFYTGAEQVHSRVNRYGVWEPTMTTFNSLPEHLWRESIHRTEPFAFIEQIETSAVRLNKLGLEFAKA